MLLVVKVKLLYKTPVGPRYVNQVDSSFGPARDPSSEKTEIISKFNSLDDLYSHYMYKINNKELDIDVDLDMPSSMKGYLESRGWYYMGAVEPDSCLYSVDSSFKGEQDEIYTVIFEELKGILRNDLLNKLLN